MSPSGTAGAGALHAEIEPYLTGRLRVGGGEHELYFEESGNARGAAALFLHGGPGGATDPKDRRYFDPEAWRIVLFDQRGCGRSEPRGSVVANTTWDLVRDVEELRQTLGVERWLLFGGSWGSTLALAYAESFPERVSAIVLRGVFLGRRSEVDWFFRRGANALFPEAWESFLSPVPAAEREDPLLAYRSLLESPDPSVRARAARAFLAWDRETSRLVPDRRREVPDDATAVASARIGTHYAVNDFFLEPDDQLLLGAHRLRGIPGVIVQGRYDVVCPIETAWALYRAWPEADLRVVPVAGHASSEPGVAEELVAATDRFRNLPR